MKNFTSNKHLRFARALITGIMFALCIGFLTGGENTSLSLTMTGISLTFGFVVAMGYTKSERRRMAFMACNLIDDDISYDVCDPLTGGVHSTFYIANKDDIESITYDGTNKMLATDITMKTTKQFFTIEGQLQSLEPSYKLVTGKYINQYEHEVKFLIFSIDPATKQQILAMKDGDFVVIVQNNHVSTTGDTKWEIYGAQGGLKLQENGRNPQDTENLGAFTHTLRSIEGSREGKPPVSLFITSAAATQTLIDDLLAPAP